jgi:hypothetical protein
MDEIVLSRDTNASAYFNTHSGVLEMLEIGGV